jgi:hypothetical protein
MPDRRRLLSNGVYYGGLLALNADDSRPACVAYNFSTPDAGSQFSNGAMLPDNADFVIGSPMGVNEREGVPTPAAARLAYGLLRHLRRALLAVFTAQYTIIAIMTGLTVAGTLRYGVTPKIVATFEALAVALKR